MSNYRILIADDEPIECTALELLLKNTFTNIQILPSVFNGIDFVSSVRENHPDVVIVDINMPGLNGLDALDMIRSRNPDMKIMIHSAYSEFEYAKRALSLNAFDYIVKPVQKPVFVETMKKIFASLEQEKKKKISEEQIHHLTGEVHRLVENDLMSSILLGVVNEHTSDLFLQSLHQEYCGGFLMTLRLLDSSSGFWNKKKKAQILSAFHQVCLCLEKMYRQDLILYLIPGEGISENNYQQWCRDLFRMFDIPLLFGVSTWKFTIEELPDALKECNSILLGKHIPGIYFFEYAVPSYTRDIFSNQKELLAELIFSGKTEECCDKIRSLFQNAKAHEIPLMPLQIYTAYFLLFLYEQITCRFSFSLYLENHLQISLRELRLCSSYDALTSKLCLAVANLNDCLLNPVSKAVEYVNRGLIYIKKMYRQNISLEDIASLVGISPFYFSRLLKQELNKTFVEVLTEIRISQALKLLQNRKKTIREIGEEVGYFNTTYFYKVFKKQTGMTVGEVRRYL